MTNFIEELRWRGMLHDMMPGTEEFMLKQMRSAYIGFDPTADSLGLGNLVQVMLLLHLQKAGHKPIALVGGATGMVGDPSGKSAERNLLSEDVLNHNLACFRKQLEQFLDFNCGENSAEIVNNYDWFKNFGFLEFIRDVGKHISINYMLAKDSVKNRLENGMSFTEFTYQLVQGYDFFHLYHHHHCHLQMGGSDQWGNIVTGTELLRRKSQVDDAFALTTPLVKKSDGTKFGKTESGNIWLDEKKTSVYKFYQFWMNAADADVKNYIRIFTLKSREEIEALEKEHDAAPHLRVLQKALAQDVTTRVHSAEKYEAAVKASAILFGQDTAQALAELDEQTFMDIFEGVPQFNIKKDIIKNGCPLIELVATHTQIFPSKGEAKKMIQSGGVSINKVKTDDLNGVVNENHVLNQKFIIIQKGKKNYYLIQVEDAI